MSWLAPLPRDLEVRSSATIPGRIADSRNRAQIGFSRRAAYYPTPGVVPGGALQLLKSFRPREPDNKERERVLRPEHRPADAEGGGRAAERPAGSTRALCNGSTARSPTRAPWVPLIASKDVNFLSKRVGNYQYSPDGIGMLIDQLWVR